MEGVVHLFSSKDDKIKDLQESNKRLYNKVYDLQEEIDDLREKLKKARKGKKRYKRKWMEERAMRLTNEIEIKAPTEEEKAILEELFKIRKGCEDEEV